MDILLVVTIAIARGALHIRSASLHDGRSRSGVAGRDGDDRDS
jgi:hypothetical protein